MVVESGEGTVGDEQTSADEVHAGAKLKVIDEVLKTYGYSVGNNQVVINDTGLGHIPGPDTDAGLTASKIVVDGATDVTLGSAVALFLVKKTK